VGLIRCAHPFGAGLRPVYLASLGCKRAATPPPGHFAPYFGEKNREAFSLRSMQGASEAVISKWILPERATRKNGQIATALRVALKMGVLR